MLNASTIPNNDKKENLMEWLIGLVVVYVIYRVLTSGGVDFVGDEKAEDHVSANSGWVGEKWKVAAQEKKAGNLRTTKPWHFDPVTEAQTTKLSELGLKVKGRKLLKGEASDVIGLFYKPDQEDLEVLKFFEVPTKGFSQSKARYEVAKLFSQDSNIDKFNTRPATLLQKEFFHFFKLSFPKGSDILAAQEIIDTSLKNGDEGNEETWERYLELYEEVNDPDFRKDYDLKSISLKNYRDAITELIQTGKTLVGENDEIFEDDVVEMLLKLKPELEKR
jgi:hypothetical protein